MCRLSHDLQPGRVPQLLQAIWENNADAIALSDPDGIVLMANPAYYRLYGLGPEQVIGKSFAIIFPEDVRERAVAEYREVFRSGTPGAPFEAVVQRADGATRVVDVRVDFIVEDGRRVAMINTIRDITSLKEAEAERDRALADEQQARWRLEDMASRHAAERDRLQRVLDVLPEGIIVADATGELIIANKKAQEFYGVPLVSDDLPVGGTATYDSFGARRLDGSPFPDLELPLQRSVLNGEVVQGEQAIFRNAATGDDIVLLLNSAPLRDASGAIVGGVVVFQDISVIKDLERQKDDFLGVVAHDLRNPLTAIKGYVELIRLRMKRGQLHPDERLTATLESMDLTSARMTRLIDDLLDTSRLQAGSPLTLRTASTDLVALVRRVIASVELASPRHKVEVTTSAATLVGEWDGGRLARVFENLLNNAAKYSPEDATISVVIREDADEQGTWAVVEIHDQGIGIPAQDLPHVFDRYFRAGNTGAVAGTGIGLAGARQIVEDHGGTISVTSVEGKGSTFTVRLPMGRTG